MTSSVGCWSPRNVVEGRVVFEGKPLPGGRVTFLCDGKGRPARSAALAKDGSYEVTDVSVGPARVSVETFRPLPKPKPSIDPVTGQEVPVEWEDTGPYLPIPDRYAHPAMSGLECTVVPGRQTFDIALRK
jgi:hypothetical protein